MRLDLGLNHGCHHQPLGARWHLPALYDIAGVGLSHFGFECLAPPVMRTN